MTGREWVAASLRKIGAIAPGESMDAADAEDGLAEGNRMLASWSNDGLLIHAITAETPLTLTASDATVTMGAAGDIATRPLVIERALIRDGTLDLPPLRLLTLDEYAAIPIKSLQSTYPTSLYDDGGYPQRTLMLWPVPSAAMSLVLFTLRALTSITTLDTVVSLPPGYDDALIYNLAIRLAPEYGRAVSDEIAALAMDTKAAIKRTNHRQSILIPDAIPAGTQRRANIYTGGFW